MHMRTEFVALRNHLDDAVAQLFGIERADSHAPDRASLRDHFQQIGKFDLRIEVLAIAAEMNAGENHFLEAARMKIVQRRDHAARLDASRSAARKRNDTEGAELIASFL